MFGNRRVPPHIVFLLSLLLAAVCLFIAFRYGQVSHWLPTVLWGGVGLWFAVDAVRAYGWAQQRKRDQASKAAQDAGNPKR